VLVPATSSLTQPLFLAILGLGSASHSNTTRPALQISGQASPTVEASVFYAFTPTVSGAADRKLKFTIRNKPAWASFGARHGTLYGVPQLADAGTYSNIEITVSDGTTSVTLPAFSIAVAAPVASRSTGQR
jgi:hypothetical protein